MAIPFVMPNEDADATLDQLIVELSDILMQIQILLRARANNQMAERRSRGKIKIKKFANNSRFATACFEGARRRKHVAVVRVQWTCVVR